MGAGFVDGDINIVYQQERYEKLLNELFLIDMDNDFMLELEECSTNVFDTNGCFMRYLTYEQIDSSVFGKSLFYSLYLVYKSNIMSGD